MKEKAREERKREKAKDMFSFYLTMSTPIQLFFIINLSLDCIADMSE